MTVLPLRLGPLAGGNNVIRSGIRWLRPDGYACRAHEVVAYCNIALAGNHAFFGEESYDLQIALAPRVPGRIRHRAGLSMGGYADRLPVRDWREDTVWATIDSPLPETPSAASEAEFLFLAGRRLTGVAENRTGILSGWHDRARAWWGEGQHRTIVAAGTCEMDGLFRGDGGYFGELFEGIAGPVQIALTQNEPLVSCAAILAEQLTRTPAQMAAIREDIAQTLLSGPVAPSGEEWAFMAALLGGLERCPINEERAMLSRSGLSRAGPAAAVCLSLTAETSRLPRHRKLGYALNFHHFRLNRAGPAIRAWLQTHFEARPRSVDDVAAHYRRLTSAEPDTVFLVVNRLSTHRHEVIQSYQGLDGEAMAGLAAVRAKELNLMLHDLSRELPNLALVDADAIAAELGMWQHVPDGVHGSGPFYAEVRNELMRQIREHAIPDLGPRAINQS